MHQCDERVIPTLQMAHRSQSPSLRKTGLGCVLWRPLRRQLRYCYPLTPLFSATIKLMLRVKLLEGGARAPVVAHPGEDLGYDLFALEAVAAGSRAPP